MTTYDPCNLPDLCTSFAQDYSQSKWLLPALTVDRMGFVQRIGKKSMSFWQCQSSAPKELCIKVIG